MTRDDVVDGRNAIGLCAGCEKRTVCTYPRMPGRPVERCLEFEELSVVQRDEAPRRLRREKARLGVTIRAERPAEPGLCSTCDLRPVCTFPRHPGGVWHCEEYR